MIRLIRIGTRGSQLALAQARLVESWLRTRQPAPPVELVIIKTRGDRFVDQPLSSLGGKGVFVKEIEEALSENRIDCAVHSMKDVPSDLAPGLRLAAVPEREAPHDVLISRGGRTLETLPRGARIGTSSLRRMALLRAHRADLSVMALRGNVDTRLRRLDAGDFDAVILAAAGLRRLGIVRSDVSTLAVAEFLPAIGQGALAIETRDDATAELFRDLNHPATALAVSAERAFLRRVGGSCRTPLAAFATPVGTDLRIEALIAAVDGREIVRGSLTGPTGQAESLGMALADELLARGGRRILDELNEAADGG